MTTTATLQNADLRLFQEVYLDDLELRRELLIKELRRIEANLIKHGRITRPALKPARRDRA